MRVFRQQNKINIGKLMKKLMIVVALIATMAQAIPYTEGQNVDGLVDDKKKVFEDDFHMQGFSKQCEYHINQIAENILAKTYVGAYINCKLALKRCEAVTEDEIEAMNTIHSVRNKLMEEN